MKGIISAKSGKKTAKTLLSLLVLGLVFSAVLVSPQLASANVITDGLTDFIGGASDLPSGTTDLKTAIGKIVQIFLGFLGVLAVVLIFYASFLFIPFFVTT